MIKTVKTLRVLISHSMPVGPRTGNILFFFFLCEKGESADIVTT